jgi:D-arabinitol 2-dehydrogenase
MASLRFSRMLLRRFVRPAPPAFRFQPFTAPLQRRTLASHQDATYPQVPYEKAESVGEKRFSQFDLDGKVFVVTGAACRPPPLCRANITPL